ncbi:methyltransferase domain-containing protein [Nocardia farcinica]|uniref:Eco57I restriction-modification methylase domain-containing protein n=1 Tax=Nocardia farcinica TaxID=37329 RepID=UPI001894E365|nr:N-6 DNA methylase [Nocardia farcinica]MBF6254260.1 methyltransferase domain-containing protein [Nocardia farcinica]MBF6263321.1 methyltransferase domain-containing protein [Nocardia farcinica]MBF6281934.1 methyltransferase domain-containing protein [Nocardia farcinica]MBF6306652.1 methyltransferase domain-containing protein [Nocardia farcinica]MBF6393271.1 methyltransferase domain-containing protein [Nocardia farcinica]
MGAPARDAGERKRHGRHYTPPELARFLARRVLAHLPPASAAGWQVLDPACGEGELLLALHREAARVRPGVPIRMTGYDLDESALARARARAAAAGMVADWHTGDFLSEAARLGPGRFDAIITNPPYVRVQHLGADTARLLSREFGLHGRIDLTHPFVTVAPRLLRPAGVLGLLCANRFLTTKAGANIRAVLLRELPPVELYDLGDTKLFAAAVLPAITVAVSARTGGVCRHVSAYEIPGDGTGSGGGLFEALLGDAPTVVGHNGRTFAVEVGTLATGEPGDSGGDRPPRPSGPDAPWRMSHPVLDSWLAAIGARTWRTIGEVAKVRVGIKTNADRVFIRDDWAAVEPRPEPQLLLDLITHRDLAPWRIDRAPVTKVLYPYDRSERQRAPVDLAEFPGAAAYLERHRAALAAREYLTGSGREWYEIWVPQRPHLWRVPKVVFPDISEQPRFALDDSGAVVNGDCYWISLADLGGSAELAYLLMGVANSPLGKRYYDAVCGNRLYSGRRRWITQYVSRLPLPDPAGPPARRIVEEVAELIAGRGSADQLDALVAAAFGVS